MKLAWGRDDVPEGRAVAVTGMGVVANCGIGADDFFAGLCRGTAPASNRVTGFDETLWFGPKEARRIDRFAQFAIAAAVMAHEQAELDHPLDADPDRSGVIFSSGIGGIVTLSEQFGVLQTKGERRISPFLVPMMMPNAGAALVSMRLGWRGPSEAAVTACAGGTHAIGAAARLVASGRCDVAIGGGAEASIVPIAMAGFKNMTALSQEGVSRPFDERRDGFVIGEGAGALVLEDLEHAIHRGARISAILAGASSTADAYHITAPAPGGNGAYTCMQLALDDAGVAPSEVTHINAHGTSTPLNDAAEAEAIEKLFGQPGPPVTSTKGVTGHALGAAGAIEAVASVLTIANGVIPPTVGFERAAPDMTLDVVAGAARPFSPGAVLSNSFGFGGHNGCLVLLPPPAGS